MKNKILLLTLTILFGFQLSFGQENELTEFNANDLIGEWYPKYNRGKLELTFEKKVTTEHKYGLSIEILKNGEFRNRYSAPCGNDTMLRTHNYSGKWSLNKGEWIITTTEPINRQGTVYKIVELKLDKLVLAEIKTE
ncbi:lipocalin family protein [Winogradskyella echinorum]|uniref:Lipocalin family protein n=1 Tax=Winogradskyella echinorum TaxID=538189 RepID=A0ABR6Y2J7_9FLAO|nr:lipocalin family protein [Winogradskyella echinorum]MBC3846972.1 lipocalin family protein [Winogradskyella echinorum]MBC5751320.1 lipocalin family protein [Winogradskyella echinorum]